MRYLLLVGAQKAGSTYLHNLLAQDPKIAVHARKEPYYFAKAKFEGTDYDSLFALTEQTEVILDSSVAYLHIEGTAERVLNKLGSDVCIAVVLRDPNERAASAFLHNAKHGRDLRSAKEAFKLESTSAHDIYLEESERIERAARRGLVYLDETRNGYLDSAFPYRYVSNSLYLEQLRPYFERFRTVVLVDFEELKLRPETVADAVRLNAGLSSSINYSRDVPKNKTRLARWTALRRRSKFKGAVSLEATARLLTQRYDKEYVEQQTRSFWSEFAFEQFEALVAGCRDGSVPPMDFVSR